jgi:hypothetical protein
MYCVYLTTYSGNKLPPYYIGSTSLENIKNGYKGSVSSLEFKKLWDDEIRDNLEFFTVKILSEHSTRKEAMIAELNYQIQYDVVKSSEYINKSLAQPDGFFGMDISGSKNPMYGKTHPNKGKSMPQNSHIKRLGMKHTKDSILKNKISQPARKKVVWQGIEYCSIAECQRSTGISKGTIKRLNGIIDPSYTNRRKTTRKVNIEKLKYNNL